MADNSTFDAIKKYLQQTNDSEALNAFEEGEKLAYENKKDGVGQTFDIGMADITKGIEGPATLAQGPPIAFIPDNESPSPDSPMDYPENMDMDEYDRMDYPENMDLDEPDRMDYPESMGYYYSIDDYKSTDNPDGIDNPDGAGNDGM